MEQVSDSADADISCASEKQSYEALSGMKEDTFQKPYESPLADDANEFTVGENIPTVVGSIEIKEKMKSISETGLQQTVDGTTDVVELTKEVRIHS